MNRGNFPITQSRRRMHPQHRIESSFAVYHVYVLRPTPVTSAREPA